MPRRLVFALCALGVLFVLVAGGCGGGAKAPKENMVALGRQLFQTAHQPNVACGFCHTLRAAETRGPFGPDLDNEFSLDRAQMGWSDARIKQLVLTQIGHPQCFDPQEPSRCMPKDIYTGGDAQAVATFVSTCAGTRGPPDCRPVPGGLRGEAGRGQYLFTVSGCPSCHFAAQGKPIGPSLYGVAGSKVELANGKTVTATDEYLLGSILAPDANIVKGFPRGLMSSRIRPGEIPEGQARAIIAYIKTLKKPGPS